MDKTLESFFTPKIIAVIGASNHPGKVGHDVMQNLLKNYSGEIYPINPKDNKVVGKPAYASILKTPKIPDLAIIVIPAEFVTGVIKECGQKGCKNIVIISSGFKEVGPVGAALEKQLVELKKKYKLRILGPNCLGYIATKPAANASFAATFPKIGNVAFLSQSGALGTAILDMAQAQKLGLSFFVSLGNKCDINELDLLDYFAADKNTKVILAYLESIDDGQKFIEVARRVSKIKQIIILKSGKTVAGGQAISSHTGSLAGAAEIYSAAFRQSGVIEAEDVMDFFDLAEGFSYQDFPQGNRVAILTNAGGPGILLTDWLPAFGLQLAELSSTTQARLKKILPLAANTHNPVDVLGDALADRYASALEILIQDKNIDSIIVALTPQRMTQIKDTAEMIGKLKAKCHKTVVLCFMGEEEIVKNYQTFAANHEPQFFYPLEAVKVLSRMYQYGLWQKEKLSLVAKAKTAKIKLSRISGFITEDVSQQILHQAKFPLYRAKFAKNIKEAVVATKSIGYPVAVKVVSPQVVHKSDVGGVKIGIKNEAELEKAISEMNAQVKKKVSGVRIHGYLVGEMVKGQEVIIGLKRDPQFGAVVMLGLGGIYT